MLHFNPALFLGISVDSKFQQKLALLNPDLKALFIQKNDSYLQEFFFKECLYLGKFIEKSANLAEFQLIFANICTLIQKLVPDFVINESELMIIPTTKEIL